MYICDNDWFISLSKQCNPNTIKINKIINIFIFHLQSGATAVKAMVSEINGNFKRLQLLQSAYNMPQSGTINATSINGYDKLTIDNFILDVKSTVYGGAGVSGIYALTKSYNQSTGILTISREYGVSAVVDVYVYA